MNKDCNRTNIENEVNDKNIVPIPNYKFTIQLGGVESPTGSIGIANAWNNNGGIYTGYLIQTYIINPATSAFADGLLYFTPITIRIYN